jgi:hypothetical protein
MKQPTIKFSHEYYKMPVCVKTRTTYLVGVTKVPFSLLPESFISYDTIYTEKDKPAYYPLPKGDLILLTLFTDSEQTPTVWTTIRRYIPKKYDYYVGLIGSSVRIEITKL